jgi:hypothetical protein
MRNLKIAIPIACLAILGLTLTCWGQPSRPVIAQEDCRNGCGPEGWISDYLGFVLDRYFEDACNRHDSCYCYGKATYCKNRGDCDEDFCDDMWDSCQSWLGFPPIYAECITWQQAACNTVKWLGDSFYDPLPTCSDYDNRGGEWECPPDNPLYVYVDGAFTGCPQHGTMAKPFTTVNAGIDAVAIGGRVVVAPASYPEMIVTNKEMAIEASGGSVVIGGRICFSSGAVIRLLPDGGIRFH